MVHARYTIASYLGALCHPLKKKQKEGNTKMTSENQFAFGNDIDSFSNGPDTNLDRNGTLVYHDNDLL